MTRGFYRHTAFLDVYVYVNKVQYRGPKYWKVKIEWWNYKQPINIEEVIKIKNEDLPNWKPCTSEGKII